MAQAMTWIDKTALGAGAEKGNFQLAAGEATRPITEPFSPPPAP